jgi:SAM-dependent methyltransferase
MMNRPELEANRKAWDAVVAAHAASGFYDVEGFLAGGCTLDPVEIELAGELRGRRLLHLQCHFGMDTLSWARRGARVAGLDFSPAAIAKARELALRAGLDAEFRVGDACEVMPDWAEAFDIVYTGGGALCWLPDLEAWAGAVVAQLRPGGRLLLRDFHPLAAMLGEEQVGGRVELKYPYFSAGGPLRFDDGLQYAAATPPAETWEWPHGLAEILQALLSAGLRLEAVREHAECSWRALEYLEQGADGRWRHPGLRGGLPLMLSVVAVKP